MKCMKLGGTIKRVGEKEVNSLLKQGWNYCPKSEWKEFRGVQSKPTEKPEKEVSEKKKGKGNPKGKAKKSN